MSPRSVNVVSISLLLLCFVSLIKLIGANESQTTHENIEGEVGPFSYAYIRKGKTFNSTGGPFKSSYYGHIEHKGTKFRVTGKYHHINQFRPCKPGEEEYIKCITVNKIKLHQDGDVYTFPIEDYDYVNTLQSKLTFRYQLPLGTKSRPCKMSFMTWPMNETNELVPRTLDVKAFGPPESPLFPVAADYFEAHMHSPYEFSCKGRVYQQGDIVFTVDEKKKFLENHLTFIKAIFEKGPIGNFSVSLNMTCYFSSYADSIIESFKTTFKLTKLDICPRWKVHHTITAQPLPDIFNYQAYVRENCDPNNSAKSNTSISIDASSVVFPEVNTKLQQIIVHDDLKAGWESLSMINTFYSVFVDAKWNNEKFLKTLKVVQNLIPLDLQRIFTGEEFDLEDYHYLDDVPFPNISRISTSDSTANSNDNTNTKQSTDRNKKPVFELRYSDDPNENYIDTTLRVARDTLLKFGTEDPDTFKTSDSGNNNRTRHETTIRHTEF